MNISELRPDAVYEVTADGLRQVGEIKTEYRSDLPNQPTAQEIISDRKDI